MAGLQHTWVYPQCTHQLKGNFRKDVIAQLMRVRDELNEAMQAAAHIDKDPEHVLEEVIDIDHAVETLKHIFNQNGFDIDKMFSQVTNKNFNRGYYE